MEAPAEGEVQEWEEGMEAGGPLPYRRSRYAAATFPTETLPRAQPAPRLIRGTP